MKPEELRTEGRRRCISDGSLGASPIILSTDSDSCRGLAVGGKQCPALLFRTIEAAKDSGHLLRVLLLFLVLGPFGVLVRVLLRPVAILLLYSEPIDIVRIHDLFNALVVV